MIANQVRTGRVLVTRGGLAYTDVRDLARVLESVLRPGLGPRRYPFGGPFLTHAEYHALLCEITGRSIKADRIPASLLKLLGWVGDLRQRFFGTWVELDGDAALVFTRSVPLDDARVRDELGIAAMPVRDSFEDLLRWMLAAGMLEAAQVPRLANAEVRSD
jgi:UDP-glucose 4-epimerase